MHSLLSFGRSIRQFRSTAAKQVFQEAQQYPSFFDKHLVHPSRRIKALINDPNANIRAFYFQYLMLCFEIQNNNYEFYITKLQKFLLDPNFSFLFLEEDDEDIFNDKQFKRFILEFMEILDSGEFESTELALSAYPLADTAFVYFFRSLAIYAEVTPDFDSYVDKNTLLGFLLQNFNIDAQIFEDKCIKFIEAEVFVYEESPAQIYLVYKDIEASISGNSSQLSHSHHRNNSATSSRRSDNQQFLQQVSVLEGEQPPTEYITVSDSNNFKKQKQAMMEPGALTQGLQQQMTIYSRESEMIGSSIQSQEGNRRQSDLDTVSPILPAQNSHVHYSSNNDHLIGDKGVEYKIRPPSRPGNKDQYQKQTHVGSLSSYTYGLSRNDSNKDYQLGKLGDLVTRSNTNPIDGRHRQNVSMPGEQVPKPTQSKNFSLNAVNLEVKQSTYIPDVTTPRYSGLGAFDPSLTSFAKQPKSRPLEPMGAGYVPATRDIPTHDYHSSKPSPIIANISPRQSKPVPELPAQQTPGQQYPTPKQHQILTSNPVYSRQFRQESVSMKQNLRQTIMTKLSVSKQFTDSLTLMKMGEPYSSNIQRMKTRSREYRQSLLKALHA